LPVPHPARRTRFAWLAGLATVVLATAAWLIGSPLNRAAASAPAQATAPPAARPAAAPPAEAAVAHRAVTASIPPAPGIAVSPQARAQCPPAFTACADLTAHVSWLQSGGRITYGPVRMEPGAADDPTPRGLFHVAWKAGAHYISTSYGVPIPYAVFFAAGGIAFHAGSLQSSSHGCIHLTLAAARYYNEHLPVGAGVAVF
jgi:lipoprotein-anchoring transpeptidase ErfK/SrfK